MNPMLNLFLGENSVKILLIQIILNFNNLITPYCSKKFLFRQVKTKKIISLLIEAIKGAILTSFNDKTTIRMASGKINTFLPFFMTIFMKLIILKKKTITNLVATFYLN